MREREKERKRQTGRKKEKGREVKRKKGRIDFLPGQSVFS